MKNEDRYNNDTCNWPKSWSGDSMTIGEVQVAQVTICSQIRHPFCVHGVVPSHINLFSTMFENPNTNVKKNKKKKLLELTWIIYTVKMRVLTRGERGKGGGGRWGGGGESRRDEKASDRDCGSASAIYPRFLCSHMLPQCRIQPIRFRSSSSLSLTSEIGRMIWYEITRVWLWFRFG